MTQTMTCVADDQHRGFNALSVQIIRAEASKILHDSLLQQANDAYYADIQRK
jgi:hypothetical protein